MLDRGSKWRTSQYGWVHSDARPKDADLYSSLYAIQLLDATTRSPEALPELADAAEEALKKSIGYLSEAWEKTGWRYESVSSQEATPLAFIEVADVLRERCPQLYSVVVDELLLQRNPAGGLQEEYRKNTDPEVSDECLLVRFAYAMYSALEPKSIWRNFADAALRGRLETLTSVEAAWLVDLQLRTRSLPKITICE